MTPKTLKPTLFHHCSGRDLPDYAKKSFDSMAVLEGEILERGFALETMSRYQSVPQIDLNGATVFPAFADAHTHFLQTGLMLNGCRFDEAKSLADVFEILAGYAQKCSDDFILGWNLDETQLKENRLPTVPELDRIVKNKIVWLSRVDLHSAVPNSNAIRWVQKVLPEALLDGHRYRKTDFYTLSGLMVAELPVSLKERCLAKARDLCRSKGVSSVHALEGGIGGTNKDVELVADFLAQPGFHGVVYHQSEDPALVLKRGWKQIGGCLFVDGSFGSRTAALKSPYADDPRNSGALYRDRDLLEKLLRMCSKHSLQLAMHAIGDAAISHLANAHAWGKSKFGSPPLSHRIEHFELPDNQSLRMAKEADLFISVQPAFEVLWGGPTGMYAQRLGKDRAASTNPFRTILNWGLPLAGGSDSPVTPIDPMLGIHGFVNHPTVEERIDLNSALAAFILEPHRFAGLSAKRGKLEKGFRADFVCLNEDPFMVPAARLRQVRTNRLFIAGAQVFPAGE